MLIIQKGFPLFPLLLISAAASGAVQHTIPVEPFHAVDLSIKAIMRVEQAPLTSVVVTGDPRLVPCVSASTQDGRLTIGWAGRSDRAVQSQAAGDTVIVTARTNCDRRNGSQSLIIEVSAPDIHAVDITSEEGGSAEILPLRTKDFAASIHGRGSITINNLHASNAQLSIDGIGRIKATGDVGTLAIRIPGSGAIDTASAHVSALTIAIAGQGDIAAAVDGPATGTIGGKGRIVIQGRPQCAIRNMGKGQVICPAAIPHGG